MEQKFDSRVACEATLRESLDTTAIDSSSKDAMVRAFADACEENPAGDASEEPSSFELRLGRWVIRDEDLKVFGTVRDTIVALASVKFVFLDLTVASIASIAFALVQLIRNAKKAGVMVTKRQAHLLGVLKSANRPLSVAELLQTLVAGDPSWNQPALKQELDFLLKTPTRGSGSVAFVAATADEKWFPAGY